MFKIIQKIKNRKSRKQLLAENERLLIHERNLCLENNNLRFALLKYEKQFKTTEVKIEKIACEIVFNTWEDVPEDVILRMIEDRFKQHLHEFIIYDKPVVAESHVVYRATLYVGKKKHIDHAHA